MSYKYISIKNRHFFDINPRQVGHKQCMPSEMDFQHGLDFTLIHYVAKGKGVLYKNHFSYEVNEGEAFIILPGEKASYQADKNNPFFYYWIGFDGTLSKKFHTLPAVFSAPGDIFTKLESLENNVTVREFHLAARIFDLYAALFSETKIMNAHVRNAEKILCETFAVKDLRFEQIAAKLGLERKYLSTLYKKETGITMQERLQNIRIEYAKELLKLGTSVADTADNCGYEFVDNFSKMFKKKTGITPQQYKNNIKNKNLF